LNAARPCSGERLVDVAVGHAQSGAYSGVVSVRAERIVACSAGDDEALGGVHPVRLHALRHDELELVARFERERDGAAAVV